MESMMTARQVAELLGVHENWVYDQAASGELPSYKIGGTRRFDPDELRSWIAGHREPDNTGRQGRRPQKAASAAPATRSAQHGERQSEPRAVDARGSPERQQGQPCGRGPAAEAVRNLKREVEQ